MMLLKNTYQKKLTVLLTVLMLLPYVLNAAHSIIHNFHLDSEFTVTDDKTSTDCHWSELQLAPALFVEFSQFTSVWIPNYSWANDFTHVYSGKVYPTFFSLRAPPQWI
ncbi:MAG TPA: hypothetical protein VKZ42_01565 [Flavobacteriaceae bacterium]|jgi:hypothetical protein|nr:hypothetical protein [Flavobacteriaceae bacterium]